MKHHNIKLINAIIIIFVVFGAFSSAQKVSAMANPATVYCTELGYKYSVEKTADGDFGMCQLPDGSKVEEWKFFTGEEKQEYNYCGTKGYTTKTVSGERCVGASKCTVCVLGDGSEKEVTQLMGLNVPAPEYSIPVIPTPSPVADVPPARVDSNLPNINNSNYYFIGTVVLTILLLAVFVVYIKNKKK